MLTDKRKAELSEIVDGAICCAETTQWDCVDDMADEILSELESSSDFTDLESEYIVELVGQYWSEHHTDEEDDET